MNDNMNYESEDFKDGYDKGYIFGYNMGRDACWNMIHTISNYSTNELQKIFASSADNNLNDILKHHTAAEVKNILDQYNDSKLRKSLSNIIKIYGKSKIIETIKDMDEEYYNSCCSIESKLECLNKYFDSKTHIATEKQFIDFLNAGIYTRDVIGFKVQININDYSLFLPQGENSKNTLLFTIADLDHDYENTVFRTRYYDLICDTPIRESIFGETYNYRSSDIRAFLTTSFYMRLSSEVKDHAIYFSYKYNDSWYRDDKIIILSGTEMGSNFDDLLEEGVKYPIFNDKSHRSKGKCYWTRSGCGDNVYAINEYGYIVNYLCRSRAFMIPVLRLSSTSK